MRARRRTIQTRKTKCEENQRAEGWESGGPWVAGPTCSPSKAPSLSFTRLLRTLRSTPSFLLFSLFPLQLRKPFHLWVKQK